MRYPQFVPAFILCCILAQACDAYDSTIPPMHAAGVVIEETPRRTANAEVADIDGDGNNDIVLAIGRHWPGPNLLFRGDGSGGFLSVDTLSSPHDSTYSILLHPDSTTPH